MADRIDTYNVKDWIVERARLEDEIDRLRAIIEAKDAEIAQLKDHKEECALHESYTLPALLEKAEARVKELEDLQRRTAKASKLEDLRRIAELEAQLAAYQEQDAHEGMECYLRTKKLVALLEEVETCVAVYQPKSISKLRAEIDGAREECRKDHREERQ